MAAPARPRRAASSSARLLRRLLPRHLLLLPAALLLFLLLPYTPGVLLRRANSLGRRCLPPPRAAAGDLVLLPRAAPLLKIAIVTLSDEGAASGSDQDRGRRGRSFRGVLAATARNKRSYAAAHGYGLAVLPAASVDPRRPPSWSKVLALRAHLHLHHHHWLFWNDADTLVTNPDIPLLHVQKGSSMLGGDDFVLGDWAQ
nr:uncharacterized protein LOC9268478 isoform X5 [Oryza sativa Japonica Group]